VRVAAVQFARAGDHALPWCRWCRPGPRRPPRGSPGRPRATARLPRGPCGAQRRRPGAVGPRVPLEGRRRLPTGAVGVRREDGGMGDARRGARRAHGVRGPDTGAPPQRGASPRHL
ncbi:MAG: hypothetical protein AVDCRST_MAG34-651, partial [uncultured Nocardioidaceae bacterium]